MKRAIYSKDLNINLESCKEGELFKWFLACSLFGKPIQQDIAKAAYREFEKEGLTSPEAIIKAGRQKLVDTLDRAHYVRYDFSTADKLLDICLELMSKYGNVTTLIHKAKTPAELVRLLEEFKGIGPVTARIFLRDLRPCLSKILRKRHPYT